MGKNKEIIEITTINNKSILAAKNDVVGFCHFSAHPGCITKNSLKEKGCSRNGCHYFEKYDVPYWKAKEKLKAALKRKKETARRIKAEEEVKNQYFMDKAQETIDKLGCNIKVLSIKKVPRKKRYIVFYISQNSQDDWYKYLEFAKCFGIIIGGRIELKHIKDVDGSYATF